MKEKILVKTVILSSPMDLEDYRLFSIRNIPDSEIVLLTYMCCYQIIGFFSNKSIGVVKFGKFQISKFQIPKISSSESSKFQNLNFSKNRPASTELSIA